MKAPSFHEIRQRIEAIRRIDLNAADPAYLTRRIQPLFHGFQNRTPILASGQKIYRAVKWDERPSSIDRLSYPPPDKVTNYQRANPPGRPIFYGSVGWNAPLFELRLKPGDHVALSRWRTPSKLIVNNIGYTESAFQRLESDRGPRQSWSPRDQTEISPVSRLLYDFFSDEFTQDVPDNDPHRYKISSSIAEILLHDLHDDDKIDDATANGMTGIVYPALAFLGHADNLVLKSEIVDNHLQLEQVEYIKIDSMEVDGKHVTFHNTHLDFANSFGSDRSIEWKDRPARWNIVIPPGGHVRVSEENGRRVYRDEAGNIIEPT